MDIVGISQKDQVQPLYPKMCLPYFHIFFNRVKLEKLLCFCQDAIFRVVAAILHLGNVEFTKGKEIDSSVLKDDKSKFHLQTAADLLM